MIPLAPILAGSGFLLAAAAADTLPNTDVKPTCRAAIEMMGSQGRTIESCMASETAAREEIVKGWAQVPKEEKTRCLQTALHSGSPSYVELLICIEMHRDSRTRQQQVKDDQAKAKAAKTPAAKP